MSNAPAWKVNSGWHMAYNAGVADISPNLCLVADGTTGGVKVPATGQAILALEGVAKDTIAAGARGDITSGRGDQWVVKAQGAITKGDTVYVNTTAGNEGKVSTYTDFATDGVEFILGVAMADAADEELCPVRTTAMYQKTA